jgi:hypothetical protein
MAITKTEMDARAVDFRSGPGALALWWGVLAGPIAFALDEVLSYAIVQHSCSTGCHWLLHFYTGLAIVLSLSGFFAAQWCYQRLPNTVDTEDGSTDSRSRWMAIYGTAASLAFIVVIIALSIPKWAMSPCDQ